MYFFFGTRNCQEKEISATELTGIYLCREKNETDSLIIYSNGEFLHTVINMENAKKSYKRQGTWKPTVQGFFEFSNYFSASVGNNWDAKPYRCGTQGTVSISRGIDGQFTYEKIGDVPGNVSD